MLSDVTPRRPANKVVILDLGNVVLDWNVERILDSLELEIEQRDLLRDELFAHQRWLDLDHGKVSEADVVAQIGDSTALRRDLVEAALIAAKNSLAPITESTLLMQEIRDSGIDMFCLSNMSRETWGHIENWPLFSMFNGIVISGVEGCMKPGEEIFHLLLQRYGLEAASALFIDDSLANVDTSRRLGINGFHFRRSRNCYAEIRRLLF